MKQNKVYRLGYDYDFGKMENWCCYGVYRLIDDEDHETLLVYFHSSMLYIFSVSRIFLCTMWPVYGLCDLFLGYVTPLWTIWPVLWTIWPGYGSWYVFIDSETG